MSKLYNDQKTKLLNNISSKNKLKLFEHNFMDEITNKIDILQDKKQSLSEARKKVKEIAIPTKTGKYR